MEAFEQRPVSALRGEPLDPRRFSVGLALTLLIHSTPPLYIGISALLIAIGLIDPDADATPPPPVEHVIAARFVQLGRPLDPHELPDRVVPILRTDTPDPRRAPSKSEEVTPPPPREEHERRRDAMEDTLRRLSEDAQQFAEAEERRLPEGDAEGVEGGTEREATEGDRYAGILATFFRRGWTVPTTMSRDEIRGLTAMAQVSIAGDLRITGFRISRPSGEPLFDQSVIDQLQRMVDANAVIPPPPEEVADQYLGRDRTFAFRGRDAR